jgi:hypothetical protein
MQKGRITITVVIEYDLVPEHYPPEDRTPELMLALDLESAKDDTFAFLMNDNIKWDLKAELVEGDTNG